MRKSLELLEATVGALLGLLLGLVTGGDAWNMVATAAGFGVAGACLGRVRSMRHTLRETTTRLEQSLERIRAPDDAKTDFFNNVSHELRSPLTLILAPLEELVAGRTPPGGERTALEAMHRNAARLLQLINQLLDLAKIDAGQMRITPLPTALVELVQGILHGFAVAARNKGVRLELDAPEHMPAVVIDPSWIESACTNLVANALRLTAPGGRIVVTIADQAHEVMIAVSDDGPGISRQDQQKIFERFAQADSTRRNVGGTGIGLALVREAVRLHGGDVTVVSELDHGATFTIRLPRRSQVLAAGKGAELPSRLPAPLRAAQDFAERKIDSRRPGPSENAPLAFVVDDNPDLREFVVDILAPYYRVRSADQGKRALAAIRELRPDVVVSDVAMPEMDGYALCRALRSDPETHAIPVVLVTARTDLASVLAGFEAGANDYVLKPFHGRELLARVDVHVRLRRMVQELAMHERHAALGVMAASIAHQVRNPLTILVSGLPAMRSRLTGQLSDSTRELIDMMIDCSERIERLTRDLMDLSRVDRETLGEYRPSDGLRAAVRMTRAQLPIHIEVDDDIMDAPTLQGRPGDMNHVFLNLLDNAVRAVTGGGKIRIRARCDQAAYTIRIGDSGQGVPSKDAERIFEPFFTTRAAGEGTGLGLSIARQVVQQCGGDIRLTRCDLGGAEFTVNIPFTGRVVLPSPLPENDQHDPSVAVATAAGSRRWNTGTREDGNG
jgi:signal transduction histidine kinase